MDEENAITPYLVSRFYRAPEISKLLLSALTTLYPHNDPFSSDILCHFYLFVGWLGGTSLSASVGLAVRLCHRHLVSGLLPL